MSSLDHLQLLFDHHFHTAQRLTSTSQALSPEEFASKPGVDRRSIQSRFFHVLNADYRWRVGLEEGQRPEALLSHHYSDVPAIRQGFEKEQYAWNDLLSEVTPQLLEQKIDLTRSSGRIIKPARWKILHHVLLHGMQHFSEIAFLVTSQGHSPGDIDFLTFTLK